MEFSFKTDEEKCIHCGLCVKDCMPKIIAFDERKFPMTIKERESSCINCQHCLSVCPTGAISVNGKSAQNSSYTETEFSSDNLLNLIKSRRSIRHFKHENVAPEAIQKLKDMLDFVPTGVNNHGLYFSFVEDVNVMDKLRATVNEKLIKILSNKAIKSVTQKFERYTDPILKGEDVIFRGAPHLVVVSVPKDAPCKDFDGTIALSYFELYAKTLGLGTCWCGLAYSCFKFIPNLKSIFNIPKNHEIAYCMLFGYPDIKYTRNPQPEKVGIETVKDIKIKEGFLSKMFG